MKAFGNDEALARANGRFAPAGLDDGDRSFQDQHELVDRIGPRLAREGGAVPDAGRKPALGVVEVEVAALYRMAALEIRGGDVVPPVKLALGALGLKSDNAVVRHDARLAGTRGRMRPGFRLEWQMS